MAYKLSKSSKKPKAKRSKKMLVILTVIVLFGVGGYFGYKHFFANKSQTKSKADDINYNPPTEQEQQAGDNQKQKITERQDRFKEQEGEHSQQNSTSNQPNAQATVVITDASQYDDVIEVRAFVSDHYQDGECTTTLTKGNLTVKKTTAAFRDVSTTICTNPLIKRSEFAEAGDWQVIVKYTSSDKNGVSKAQTVTIK